MPKKCKHCGRPVGVTIGNLGYCKKCLEEAKKLQKEKK